MANPRGHQAGYLLISGTLFFGFLSTAQSQQASSPLSGATQQSTPQTVVSLLWKTILTECPVPGSSPPERSYFYTGSPRQNRVLYEYRETPKTEDTIFPEALSTPDRLNGIEWRGIAKWYAGAYRTWEDGGSGWSEWMGMRKEDVDPTQIVASLGSKPLAGNLIFFLEKKRGKWSIETVSMTLGGLRREAFEPEEYWATKASCGAATSASPLAVPNTTTAGTPSNNLPNDQNYTKLIEDLVSENARTWLMNRYIKGSSRNPTVISTDTAGRPLKVTAQYLFDGFGGRSPGTVTLTFSNGVPACLYFFDNPTDCRAPSQAIVNAYAGGRYTDRAPANTTTPRSTPPSAGNDDLDAFLASLDKRRSEKSAGLIAVDDIPEKLKSVLTQQASELKLSPSQIATAVDAITGLSRLCAAMPASGYRSSWSYGFARLGVYQGGRYRPCQTYGPLGLPNQTDEVAGLLVARDLDKNWNQDRGSWAAAKFHLDVYRKEPTKMTASDFLRDLLFSADIAELSAVATPNRESKGSGRQILLGKPRQQSDADVLSPNGGAPGADAILTIVGGYSKPLAWGHYELLQDDPATVFHNAGISVPSGARPDDFMRVMCETDRMECNKMGLAIGANRLEKISADRQGGGVFKAVRPGTYYLMISVGGEWGRFMWSQRIDLKAGANSTTLDYPERLR